jgi:hypothetical protein
VRSIEDEGGTVAGAYLREGHAVDAFVEQAEEIDAGLLVVGSRGLGRFGRLVLGSVSMGLVHRSPCPVLIVREGEEAWPPDRILVVYGSFEDTGRAGFLGASLGWALGARVELVAVEGDGDDAEQRLRHVARNLEARADEIEEAVGERPRVRPVVGDPPEMILGIHAESGRPALLSFGSKVLGRAGRVMKPASGSPNSCFILFSNTLTTRVLAWKMSNHAANLSSPLLHPAEAAFSPTSRIVFAPITVLRHTSALLFLTTCDVSSLTQNCLNKNIVMLQFL